MYKIVLGIFVYGGFNEFWFFISVVFVSCIVVVVEFEVVGRYYVSDIVIIRGYFVYVYFKSCCCFFWVYDSRIYSFVFVIIFDYF